MLGLVCFFAFFCGAFATTCTIKDPQTNQAFECQGDFCAVGKLTKFSSTQTEVPVIVHGCINGSSINESDLGCFSSITDMDEKQYCRA